MAELVDDCRLYRLLRRQCAGSTVPEGDTDVRSRHRCKGNDVFGTTAGHLCVDGRHPHPEHSAYVQHVVYRPDYEHVVRPAAHREYLWRVRQRRPYPSRDHFLQGTNDAVINDDTVWLEYEFKCKPGDVHRRPCVVSPYHYRLDWQIHDVVSF